MYCIWWHSLCENADLLGFLGEAYPVSFWNVSFAVPEIQEHRREKKKPEHSLISSLLSTPIITKMQEERRKFKWAKKRLVLLCPMHSKI